MKATAILGRLSVSPLPVPANWYAVPLRLVVGFGFLEHGYAKLARGADGFIAPLHSIGTPLADLLGWTTIVVEIVGGLMILIGSFVPRSGSRDDHRAGGSDLHGPSSNYLVARRAAG